MLGEKERAKIERQRELKSKPSIKDRTGEIVEMKLRKTQVVAEEMNQKALEECTF